MGRTQSASSKREPRNQRLAARLTGTSAKRKDSKDGKDAKPGHDEFTLFLDTQAGELVHEIMHGFGVGDPGLGLPGKRRPARTKDLMSTPVAADGGVSPLPDESMIEVLQRIDDGNRDPEGDQRPGDPDHSTHSGPDRRLAPGLRGRPSPDNEPSTSQTADPDPAPDSAADPAAPPKSILLPPNAPRAAQPLPVRWAPDPVVERTPRVEPAPAGQVTEPTGTGPRDHGCGPGRPRPDPT